MNGLDTRLVDERVADVGDVDVARITFGVNWYPTPGQCPELPVRARPLALLQV